MNDSIYKRALKLHRQYKGKLSIKSLIKIKTKDDLSLIYTPGVAEPSRVIAKSPQESFNLTLRGRTVAVISNGTAVLGLGDIGPEAALPVMEGKAQLLKDFAGVDAFPLVIKTRNPEEIVKFVKEVAPTFAGINLEDITAPVCFQVEEALQDIGIPVFHDDQHGTAIVVAAALSNAAKVVGKKMSDLKVVISGAGAAGIAITRLLLGLECLAGECFVTSKDYQVKDLILIDSKGIIHKKRHDLNIYKQALLGFINKENRTGGLAEALVGADAFIGVSRPKLVTPSMISTMTEKPIVFAMANPEPEILPDEAEKGGAFIVGSGRSDYPNQINNVLAFPGIFRAVIDGRLKRIDLKMKIKAAKALAGMIKPTRKAVLPDPFYPHLAEIISKKILEVKSVQS